MLDQKSAELAKQLTCLLNSYCTVVDLNAHCSFFIFSVRVNHNLCYAERTRKQQSKYCLRDAKLRCRILKCKEVYTT